MAILGVLVMAALTGLLAKPLLVARTLVVVLEGPLTAPWAILWTQTWDRSEHGAWIHGTGDVAVPNYPLTDPRLVPSGPVDLCVKKLDLVTRVLGVPVKRVPLRPLAGAVFTPELTRDGTFTLAASNGETRLSGDLQFGLVTYLVLVLLGLATTAAAAVVVWLLSRPWLTRTVRGIRVEHVAAVAVVGAHVWVMSWAPMMMAGDSPDYTVTGSFFAETGSFSRLTPYRLPGYPAFLAPFISMVDRYAPAVGQAQAVLGIATAWLVFMILRRYAPRPFPALAALWVGVDPVLLMHERYILAESLATFTVTLALWLTVVAIDSSPSGSRRQGYLAAAAAGITGAGAAYVRGNLLVVTVLIPLALLAAALVQGATGDGLKKAAIAALVVLLCIGAWCVRNLRLHDHLMFQSGANFAKAVTAWNNGVIDPNQSTIFSPAEVSTIEQGRASRTMNDFGFLAALYSASGFSGTSASDDEKNGLVVRESAARHPYRVLRSMLWALTAQLNIWTSVPYSEQAWLSLPLRGEPVPFTNNIPFDTSTLGWLDAAHLERMLTRAEQDIRYLRGSLSAKVFNDLYWLFRALRPVIFTLFLLGCGFAIRERNAGLLALAVIFVAHACALSILLMAVIDRYPVPFKPVIAIVAAYGLSWLMRERAGPPTTSHGIGPAQGS